MTGHTALDPKPSASRWYGVRLVRAPGAGVERQDRDVLPELAQAGDQAAARERDVVRVGRNEHMGHGRPSIAGRLVANARERSIWLPLDLTPSATLGKLRRAPAIRVGLLRSEGPLTTPASALRECQVERRRMVRYMSEEW